jgi:hypothetical protein
MQYHDDKKVNECLKKAYGYKGNDKNTLGVSRKDDGERGRKGFVLQLLRLNLREKRWLIAQTDYNSGISETASLASFHDARFYNTRVQIKC